MAITVSKFLDVAGGLQPDQFSVGSHAEVTSLDELDPTYKQLFDGNVTAVVAVIGGDGRPNLTPMWFDYAGDKVLVNVASHRKKVEWMRKTPTLTILLLNPATRTTGSASRPRSSGRCPRTTPTRGRR